MTFLSTTGRSYLGSSSRSNHYSRVFFPILEKLSFALDSGLLHCEEETKFAEVAAVFVTHCMEFVKKHRHFIASDPEYSIQLEYILK